MANDRQDAAVPRSSPPQGFDFTHHMRSLCADMVGRLPQLAHIDLERVGIGFSQARKNSRHGTYAMLIPMRFANGDLVETRRGRLYTFQRVYRPDGVELLYLLSFYLPRFLDLPLQEKLVTIVHELWHISPQFDGDLRRHEGRCFAHTGSTKQYDRQMEQFIKQWYAEKPPHSAFHFLRYNFAQLTSIYGSIHGIKTKHPKLVPINESYARQLRRESTADRQSDT